MAAAFAGYRSAARKHDKDCDKRMTEVREALRMGMTLKERDDDDDAHAGRWSHLP